MSHDENLILMAEIVGVHGIRGMVKMKVFCDAPERLPDYAPLRDAAGAREFSFVSFQPHQNVFLAMLEGVEGRTEAEKLRSTKLYVSRDRLPKLKEENTYYHVDLIGLTAKDSDGNIVGRIIQVANFGSTDLLEIKPPKGQSFYLPFTHATVPDVDLKKREATIVIPPGLLD